MRGKRFNKMNGHRVEYKIDSETRAMYKKGEISVDNLFSMKSFGMSQREFYEDLDRRLEAIGWTTLNGQIDGNEIETTISLGRKRYVKVFYQFEQGRIEEIGVLP
jgi:hypothetical protein